MLIAAAEAVGDTQTQAVCERSLEEELSMASDLERQLRRRDFQLRAIYLATLVCRPISMPSLRSSPWFRRSPQRVGEAHLGSAGEFLTAQPVDRSAGRGP